MIWWLLAFMTAWYLCLILLWIDEGSKVKFYKMIWRGTWYPPFWVCVWLAAFFLLLAHGWKEAKDFFMENY